MISKIFRTTLFTFATEFYNAKTLTKIGNLVIFIPFYYFIR
jgi:hypothetical protein